MRYTTTSAGPMRLLINIKLLLLIKLLAQTREN